LDSPYKSERGWAERAGDSAALAQARNYWEQQEKIAAADGTAAPGVYYYFFDHTPTDYRIGKGWLGASVADKALLKAGVLGVLGVYGACHSCEIPFVYGEADYAHTTREHRLVHLMSNYWTNVGTTRDPNTTPTGRVVNASIPALPKWEPYEGPPEHRTQYFHQTTTQDSTEFAEMARSRGDPHRLKCNFWDKHPPSSGWPIPSPEPEPEPELAFHSPAPNVE
jgi:carboxylesterase type B